MTLVLEFSHRGIQGLVRATVDTNRDPVHWGYREIDFGDQVRAAIGFPVCRATVEHRAGGYARLMGWVQTVWTNGSGTFDPWAPFEGLDLPFSWIGFAAELFDAPWRSDRSRDLDWEAHSWLCGPPASLIKREVGMLCGFRWGYRLRQDLVDVWGPERLEVSAWQADLPVLRAACPTWTFQ